MEGELKSQLNEFFKKYSDDKVAIKIAEHPGDSTDGEWLIFYEVDERSPDKLLGARAVKFYLDTCELFFVYIDESSRMTGVSTRLFREAMIEASSRRCRFVGAAMATRNPAREKLFAKYKTIVENEFDMKFSAWDFIS